MPKGCTPDKFLEYCESKGRIPTWEMAMIWLDNYELKSYLAKDGTQNGEYDESVDFNKVLEPIRTLTTSEIVQSGMMNKANAGVVIFTLKQAIHGYTDQVNVKEDTNITVSFGDGFNASELFG